MILAFACVSLVLVGYSPFTAGAERDMDGHSKLSTNFCFFRIEAESGSPSCKDQLSCASCYSMRGCQWCLQEGVCLITHVVQFYVLYV